MPAHALVISLISVDVKGFQVVKYPGVEDFPVLWLMGELKLNLGASQQLMGQEAIAKQDKLGKHRRTTYMTGKTRMGG